MDAKVVIAFFLGIVTIPLACCNPEPPSTCQHEWENWGTPVTRGTKAFQYSYCLKCSMARERVVKP